MPTLVYKLKFELDKSKVAGLDKIVNKEVESRVAGVTKGIKKMNAELDKTSGSSKRAEQSTSRHVKRVQEFASETDRLVDKLRRTKEEYERLERQDGLNAKSTQRKARKLKELNAEVLRNAQLGSQQLDRLKLTDSEYKKLSSSVNNLNVAERQSSKIINGRTAAINKAKEAQKAKAQAERQAAAAIQKVDKSLERLQKQYTSTIGDANKFVDATKTATTALRSNVKVYGDQHRSTFLAQAGLKKYIQTIERQKQAVTRLINTGRLNDKQLQDSRATLTRLNNAHTQAVTGLRVYRAELKKGSVAVQKLTAQQKRQAAAMRTSNKSFAIGNQLAFSMGDLIQDASQFNFGFATGMRAIGNNIAFSAEMFALLAMQAKQAGKSTASFLRGSLTPVTVGILALNAAITASTIISQRREAALRKEKEAQDELGQAISATATKDIQGFSDEYFKATEQLTILRSVVESLQKQLEPELDATFKIQFDVPDTLIDPNFATAAADNLRVTADNAETFVEKLKEADKQEKEILQKTRDIVLDKIATIEAQQLINETLKETVRLSREAALAASKARPDLAPADITADGVAFLTPLLSTPLAPFDGLSDEDRQKMLDDIAASRINANKLMFDKLFEDEEDYFDRIKELDAQMNASKIANAKLTRQALLNVARALSVGSKEIALAILAIEKSLAIAEVIVEGTKRSTQAATAAAFFSANPLTSKLGKKYLASIPVIKASTAAGVAAIAAQGLAQGSAIMRAGRGSGSGGGGGDTSSGSAATQQRGFFENPFTDTRTFTDPQEMTPTFDPKLPPVGSVIILEGSLNEEVMAYKVKSGNAKIESGTTYLGD